MLIFDAHDCPLRPTDDGVRLGADFHYCSPMARELGLPGVVFAEPLRPQLGFGESIENGEREAERIQRRYSFHNYKSGVGSGRLDN